MNNTGKQYSENIIRHKNRRIMKDFISKKSDFFLIRLGNPILSLPV